MKNRRTRLKVFGLFFVAWIFLFYSALYSADLEGKKTSKTLDAFSFSLKGGYAHTESRGGMAEFMAEFVLSLSTQIRAGLGVGYLSDTDEMHMGTGFVGMSAGMMGRSMDGLSGGLEGHGHSFRMIPITLNLYYVHPIQPGLNVFMVGGGGYYLGSFRDVSTQEKSAFGPHLGAGIDLCLAKKVALVGQAVYRFVSLKNFSSELHPGFRVGEEGHEEGFWHYHHGHEEWHFHYIYEEGQMMDNASLFNISLNGFSLRFGVRFLF